MHKVTNTQFAHILWHYTNSSENLFELSPEDLYVYVLLITEVINHGH